MNVVVTILNIVIFQGLVVASIILRSPIFRSRANAFLAMAIYSLSFSLLNFVLDDLGVYENYPIAQWIDVVDSAMLFPSFIFLYIIHQIEHPVKDRRFVRFLFLPYFYTLICNAAELLVDANQIQFSYVAGFVYSMLQYMKELLVLLFVPTILFYSYSFLAYAKQKQEKKWLSRLWFLTFFIFFTWVLSIVSVVFLDLDFVPMMKILTLVSAFLIHWLSYVGIFKFQLAQDQEEIRLLLNKQKKTVLVEAVETEEMLESTQPEIVPSKEETFTRENHYFQQLEGLCLEEQIYRDSSLDRVKVASILGISTGYLSQIVNSITGENFSTYINRHRVEAVKKLVLDPSFEHYSLLAIGLECGFSSKTTFYNSFKKECGMTPNAYRKAHK